MDIQTLKKNWHDRGEKLYTYSHSQIDNSILDKNTIKFLIECGLPLGCAPTLDFSEIQEGRLLTPNQVFKINFEELIDYRVFGYNGSGDPICFDTKEKNEIVYLNHDNYFERVFINETILQFSNCLLKYRDFFRSLVDLKNLDSFVNRKFADEEFELLQTDFLHIDNTCLADNTFWKAELDYLVYERDNE